MAGIGTGTQAGKSIAYSYNADGLRVKKTVTSTQTSENITTSYTLHGKNIMHLTQGSNNLHFHYDAQNRVSQVDFNGMRYGYLHNLRGDIIAIVDPSGGSVVEYSYDAWGKPIQKAGTLASTLGTLNPFRYRRYVYDEETGLFYVGARYYDPVTGRFTSPDLPETLTAEHENFAQYSLYAYCFNNPVNMSDEDGTWSSWATKIAIGVGAVSHRVSTGSWSGSGKAALGGAVDGFASGFMTGGIMAGASQVVSGGFKVAAQAGVKTGQSGGIGNTGILSPNRLRSAQEVAKIGQKGQSFYDYGGQILKIGSTKLDIGSKTFLHLHTAFTGASHIPIGTIGAGLYGGLRR